jgi:hypothetical protein
MNVTRCNIPRLFTGKFKNIAIFASALMAFTFHAHAASRGGGATDDSVCEIGSMEDRSSKIDPYDFVQKSCRNGQLLTGTSVVPLGSNGAQIENLAGRYCLRAEIEVRYFKKPVAGMEWDYAAVKCKISKLEPTKSS